jgi:hypothetical protein
MATNKRKITIEQHIDTTFERRIALFTAVGIVVLVAYLVIRNENFANENLVVALRIILSLAVGLIGGTIPGILKVEYNVGGFVIRAAGALALIVITYFGTPEVKSLNLSLPMPKVDISPIEKVDFRTTLNPNHNDKDRQNAFIYLTVPLTLRNSAQPSKSAFVNKTHVRFSFEGLDYQFSWRNFVTMNEERDYHWGGIDSDATPFSVDAGKTVSKEILHSYDSKDIHWGSFIDALKNSKEQLLIISIYVDIDDQEQKLICKINLSYWGNGIRQFMEKEHKYPESITTDCI